MLRQTLPIEQIGLWTQLVGANCKDVVIAPGENGTAVFTTKRSKGQEVQLMTVPPDLVLSLETVWLLAKSDRHLLQILEATGQFSRTARGAVIIFLLLQLTHNASDGSVGAANSFSQYVKFLPQEVSLPTFWNEDEVQLIQGTSLETATTTKLTALDREFDHLRDTTSSMQWCNHYWWDADTGQLTIDDWKYADAVYRSRALDLPGTGHSMVACIDMANHASGQKTNALYETGKNSGAVLMLRDGIQLEQGQEVTITYGDDKGASEMLFSYGFLEEGVTDAKELFLDISIPDDDPLGLAKKTAARSPPGFKIYKAGDSVRWEGPLIWLLCINEEDGLEFKVAQSNDGQRELIMTFKDRPLDGASHLETILCQEPLWEVYRLRTFVMIHTRVEEQLLRMKASEETVQRIQQVGELRPEIEGYAIELRDLEETLLLEAYEAFHEAKTALLNDSSVQKYLGGNADTSITDSQDDSFS